MHANPSCSSLILAATLALGACGGGGGDAGPPSGSNHAPVANAGSAQSVKVGVVVTLDASASSDVENDSLSYVWTLESRPAGSTAALSLPTASKPTFAPDAAGTFVFRLTVNDGKADSTPATVAVEAHTTNQVPVANAGTYQVVTAGTPVTLDASASSDADGDNLTYRWTLESMPVGSATALSSNIAVRPTLTPDLGGIYFFSLIVNDGAADSAPVTVYVEACGLAFRSRLATGPTPNIVSCG